jgi:hypothetical protein
MSQENVELAREAYVALGVAVRKRELDAFFREYVQPEIEYVPLEGAPDAAVQHGHGFRQGPPHGDAFSDGGASDRS